MYLIVIGKFFTASSLGYYTRAHQFSDFPSSSLTGIMQRVTYPVLCQIQNDDERLALFIVALKVFCIPDFSVINGIVSSSKASCVTFTGRKVAVCSHFIADYLLFDDVVSDPCYQFKLATSERKIRTVSET